MIEFQVPEKVHSYIINLVEKQDWYCDMDRAIISARMKTMADEFFIKGVMLSVAIGFAGILVSYLFYIFQTGLTTVPVILTVYAVMILIPVICFYMSLTFIISYPKVQATERGKIIDEKMPAFASHMAILLQNNSNLLDAFEFIDKSKLYGEICEEIEIILRRTAFNINFIDAIQEVARTTSSYEFRKYLNGIVETTLNVGTLAIHLKNTSENLNRLLSTKTKEHAQNRAALIEIYTVSVVMMPLMILLALMTTALMGSEIQVGDAVVYGYIPFASIVFILMAEREIKMEVKPERTAAKETGKGKGKNNDKNKLKEKFNINDYLNTEDGRLAVGAIAGLPVAYLAMHSGLGIDTTIMVFFIVAILPYGLYWRGEVNRLHKEEEAMPIFLRNVADRNRMGYGMTEIFEPSPVYEHINKKVKKIYGLLKMGENLETAISMLNEKGSYIMTRGAGIINDALRCGGNISKILESVGEDIQNSININREVEGDMKMNTKMIMATYFLFVGITWLINSMFFKAFSAPGASVPLDMEYYRRLFYHSCALTGIFAGLVISRYEQGDLRPGLVFSSIFTFITVVVFRYV